MQDVALTIRSHVGTAALGCPAGLMLPLLSLVAEYGFSEHLCPEKSLSSYARPDSRGRLSPRGSKEHERAGARAITMLCEIT